ncbi:hypothetical protein HUA74_09550 [Myxococcus sp. CA051A]|uniref:hypothetical protein n=1 Tax=unclassified Myxococcus TaxID=2648731 RepID=UPI00157AECB1|nr:MULTISPECIES: hypothetical protein [unclassified Myxococcus]NTX58330.1 hypothetical protein [Myxococcus sp. CA039A]NTX60903.1 hypothetical protein [Myxococcus sp. CA051A]
MLRIRESQITTLRLSAEDARVEQRVGDLLAEQALVVPGPARVEPTWTRERLRPVVRRAVDRGILALEDVRLYVSLAESLGADFEEQRPHAWMRTWLDDAGVSDPVARLRRVVNERRRREDVVLQNRRKEEAFRLLHAPPGTDT